MKEHAEMIKVATVGSGGTFAALRLADVATIVSILVGLATFAYVATKLFFLIKFQGREPKP